MKNLAKIGKMNMFLKYKIKSYQNILHIVFGGIDFIPVDLRKTFNYYLQNVNF